MKRVLVFALAAMMVSSWTASNAAAQRYVGTMMRGGLQRGYSNRAYRPAYGLTYGQPTNGYRSFAYEPTTFNVGDHMEVTGDATKVMMGSEVKGTVPKGTKFTVAKVVNGWLGTVIEIEGKKLSGWIWHGGAAFEAAMPIDRMRAQGDQTYRSFSYEPAATAPVYRNVVPRKKMPWQYPKGDPRRYRN